MKKTLITLLALGGLAMAAEQTVDIEAENGAQFNAAWPTTLLQSGWQQGDGYYLDFVVGGGLTNGQFMKLADNCYLISQQSKYFGVNTVPNNNVTPSNYTFSKETSPVEVRILTAGTAPLAGWAQNANGNSSETRTMGDELFVSINYSKDEGTTVTYTYEGDALMDQFVMPTTNLDLTNFMMINGVTLYGGSLTVYSNVPEPTTGALSLLAMAGLCIRRRK